MNNKHNGKVTRVKGIQCKFDVHNLFLKLGATRLSCTSADMEGPHRTPMPNSVYLTNIKVQPQVTHLKVKISYLITNHVMRFLGLQSRKKKINLTLHSRPVLPRTKMQT